MASRTAASARVRKTSRSISKLAGRAGRTGRAARAGRAGGFLEWAFGWTPRKQLSQAALALILQVFPGPGGVRLRPSIQEALETSINVDDAMHHVERTHMLSVEGKRSLRELEQKLNKLGKSVYVDKASSRAAAEPGRARGRASMAIITLYRAANDDYVDEGYSFAEDESVARLYLDNPGYGGGTLYRARVRVAPDAVADLRGKSADEVGSELGLGWPGAIGIDEYLTRPEGICVRSRLAQEGYEWAIVDESYPAGAATWVWLGAGTEPKLVKVRVPRAKRLTTR